jgi:hypothetical protein
MSLEETDVVLINSVEKGSVFVAMVLVSYLLFKFHKWYVISIYYRLVKQQYEKSLLRGHDQ